MAVPDTNTFNLRDVTDEFGLGDGDSLQDCFNDSSAGDFDSDYNPNFFGTSNNLLNFRNYGGTESTFVITGFTTTDPTNSGGNNGTATVSFQAQGIHSVTEIQIIILTFCNNHEAV